MKITNQSRIQLRIQKVIFLLLFFSGIGMLAWLSNHYTQQFDLTSNKRHSLSTASIDLLNTLNKNITIHAYTTDDVTKKAVEKIISRYQKVNDDFKLRLLHPDLDIEQVKIDGIVMDKPFAFVVYYNNRKEYIDSLSEHEISNALLRLNRRDNQQIVFITGHGERDIHNVNNFGYSELKQQLITTGFNINTLNLLNASIPDNTKLLVIAGPDHDYLSGEITQLQKYITDGGNVFWLADPGSLNGLKPQATSLGIQLQEGVVVDNNPYLRKTLNIQSPAVIPVTEYYPHAITKTLRYNTLFSLARGISPLTNKTTINNWQTEALFSSFGASWSETAGLTETMTFNSNDGDTAGPITIGVALHRQSINNSDASTNNSQRVVVIGDSDFLSNSYLGDGANLNLGLNIFNWLMGDDDLISVGAKLSPDTKLELSNTQLMVIAFGFFLIIPIALLIIGFRIWFIRKNR